MSEIVAQTEGLLHLAALTVAVTIAYVGLDRVHPTEKHLLGTIEGAKSRVELALRQYDAISENGVVSNFVYKVAPLYVLSHIANRRTKANWFMAILYWFYRMWHVPMLGYFRHRVDLWAISGFSAVGTVGFILLTASLIWPLEFVDERFIDAYFWFFLISFGWVVFTVLASFKLFAIDQVCEKLQSKIQKRLAQAATAQLKVVPDPQGSTET